MVLPSDVKPNHFLLGAEFGLTAITVTLAFVWPRLGAGFFERIERSFARLARGKGWAVAVVGLSAIVLRLALLPFFPIPLPFVPDDFSFLLAGDTFVHGRLTNPTPAMWTHFESIHITMQPTYQSMYFPGQGLLLAAGQVLFGQPWLAELAMDALMCAGLVWMLQAWLPRKWALLGGVIAVLRLGLFSYWINTYHGGALPAAFGGALVLGSLPRLMKTGRFRYGLLMGIGIALLILTRPYEGVLLCLPVTAVLGRWIVKGKNRPPLGVLARRAVVPLLLVGATLAWLGYYDYRAFGNPLTLPYTVDREQYAITPYYVWQHLRPEPAYRHPVIRDFYEFTELPLYLRVHSLKGFVLWTAVKAAFNVLFFAGFSLLPPLFMFRRVFLDRRIRLLVVCTLVLAAGMAIEIYCIPYYLAPFTAAFYAIGLQMMRHLRVWKSGRSPVGLALVRFTIAACVVMAGVRVLAEPLHREPPEWAPGNWNLVWFGPQHFGVERARLEAWLEGQPGQQLVIVRYGRDHNLLDEWVYNGADIDGSKVVWAREMDAADNLELIHYYKGRKVWLVEPDEIPARITPYPIPVASGNAH
ncbi:MAG: hypothetical protein ABSG10_12935 [Terracidiphilus sp.]|jgi:hypothetical protein